MPCVWPAWPSGRWPIWSRSSDGLIGPVAKAGQDRLGQHQVPGKVKPPGEERLIPAEEAGGQAEEVVDAHPDRQPRSVGHPVGDHPSPVDSRQLKVHGGGLGDDVPSDHDGFVDVVEEQTVS